jgi:hypothetical protein
MRVAAAHADASNVAAPMKRSSERFGFGGL